MRILTVAVIFAFVSSATPARAQHDHGGHGMPAESPRSPEAAAKEARAERTRQISKLQDKIDALDTELERADLKLAKRKKLEKKLQKLLDKKNKLIDGAQVAGAVFVCTMGDYSGPQTSDGRCPKCSMTLIEKK